MALPAVTFPVLLNEVLIPVRGVEAAGEESGTEAGE